MSKRKREETNQDNEIQNIELLKIELNQSELLNIALQNQINTKVRELIKINDFDQNTSEFWDTPRGFHCIKNDNGDWTIENIAFDLPPNYDQKKEIVDSLVSFGIDKDLATTAYDRISFTDTDKDTINLMGSKSNENTPDNDDATN